MVSELEKPTPAEHEIEHHHRQSTKMQNLSAMGVSLVVHLIAILLMGLVHHTVMNGQPQVQVESIMTEEPQREEFEKVLEVDTTPADTLNTVAGGIVSTQVGSSGASSGTAMAATQTKIESSNAFKDPSVKVNVGDVSAPSLGTIGNDLGESQVKGEGGAFVEGYGAALGRVTQELIRLMRSDPVQVVWLFDESESMKDDQKEIRDNFHKVYEELGLVAKKDNELKKKGADILLTSVVGFGEKYHELLKSSSDVQKIKDSIDKIAIDESGKEYTCQSIQKAIEDHRVLAQRGKRKLVIIVVSDESGDDGDKVEDALAAAKKAGAPIYIMGREAIFGYKFARIKWKDPKYGLWHWLPIMRGPETAYRECLQWDGLHARWDSFSSGFGPYEQVRLAKESGGIFFVLPGEEENLSGAGAHEKRQFDALDMKEYEPILTSRRQYATEVTQSKFRTTLNDVIRILDPEQDKELNIRELHYSLKIDEFKVQASQEVGKASRAMSGLNQVIPMLEGVKNLRAKEESERWRAHYDLILAQCYAYRVRLFQYLLAMDGHVATDPKPKSQLSNEWNVGRTPKMIVPDEAQFGRLKAAFKLKTKREEYLQELKEHEQRARELFEYVTTEHPRTPWARRAQYELGMGFGMQFYDAFRDPNYAKNDIKVPNF